VIPGGKCVAGGRRLAPASSAKSSTQGCRELISPNLPRCRLLPIVEQHSPAPASEVTFSRRELDRILRLYGRKVAAGEWRDYAIDFLKDRAVFSVFRRASEMPIYRIEKNPKLGRRQGAYSVISATGHIVRRGHELDRVLGALDRSLRVVTG
jgi:hypothetical protein